MSDDATAETAESGTGRTDTEGSALVVGVGPGIGAAVVRRFARDGADVGAVARNGDRLRDLAADTAGPGTVHPLPADATDPEAPERVVGDLRAAAGPVRTLVLNVPAADGVGGTATTATPEDLRRAWEGQVLTTLRFVRAAGADLHDGGTVVVTNAITAKRATGSPPRVAARWALRGLTLSLANGYGDVGVQVVHLLVDGWVDKPSLRRQFPDHETWTDPATVADACRYLADQSGDGWTNELDLRAAGDDVRV